MRALFGIIFIVKSTTSIISPDFNNSGWDNAIDAVSPLIDWSTDRNLTSCGFLQNSKFEFPILTKN